MKRGKLIVIVGPTAVGKTGVAIRLAQHFHCEIVSADSRQVFRELEIGTAKPSPEELKLVRHYFINSHSIADNFDAGTFGEEGMALLTKLLANHERAILCGGSGLYIKSVLEGFDNLPEVPADVREKVMADYRQYGIEALQAEVMEKDPDYYEVVDRKNPQRLMRAVEVIRHSGQPFSGFHSRIKKDLPFDVVKIGLEVEREELYRRIDARMDDMINCGLFKEAEQMFSKRDLPALQTVGYQEIFDFLEGKYDKEEAVRLLKRNSRRYAKRQLTWFRKDPAIRWFHPDDYERILDACTNAQ